MKKFIQSFVFIGRQYTARNSLESIKVSILQTNFGIILKLGSNWNTIRGTNKNKQFELNF